MKKAPLAGAGDVLAASGSTSPPSSLLASLGDATWETTREAKNERRRKDEAAEAQRREKAAAEKKERVKQQAEADRAAALARATAEELAKYKAKELEQAEARARKEADERDNGPVGQAARKIPKPGTPGFRDEVAELDSEL